MLTEHSISEIRELVLRLLTIRGISKSAIDLIVEDYLGAQLQGRLTHGLGKLLLIDEARSERRGEPKVVLDGGFYGLIDGNREIGQVVAAIAIEEVVKRATRHGIGLCGIVNYSRYSRLGVISGRIAQAGFIGLVLNNAGPAAVTPFDGIDPILGTNPISFAFPTDNEPVVMDFSTAERVWGEIRQAMLERRPLPNGAFLDKDGNVTTQPEAVSAVKPFDGARGYALCLAVEILAGAFVPAKVGLAVDDQFDLGALLLAIKPNMFGSLDAYQKKVMQLVSEIRRSRPTKGKSAVVVPGDRARAAEEKQRQKGTLMVDSSTYERLKTMATDPSAGGLAGNRLTD